MTHSHLIQRSLFIERKEKRLEAIEKQLEALKTPPHIASGILTGVTKYYNNNELQQHQHLPTSISNQTVIGWKDLCRGRINKHLTQELSLHYASDNKPYSFTGRS